MGPIRNPRWKQKRTEGYVIVSNIYHGKLSHLILFYFKKYVATIYLWNQMRRPPNSCDTEQVDLKIGEKKHWLWILSPIIWAIHATGACGTDPPPFFFLTFCLQIYFQYHFFISLLFHFFFLILTCSCQYSYNLMLTSI